MPAEPHLSKKPPPSSAEAILDEEQAADGLRLSPTRMVPIFPWMDSNGWHADVINWAGKAYEFSAPQVSVRGRMAAWIALIIFFALIWLLIRAYQVIQTPNEVLVEKLGLDIPPAPELVLEDIQGREIRVSWKQNDTYNTLDGYTVQVNGEIAGETRRSESGASIHNLKPDTFYDIRVFATSTASFQTPSSILRVRTRRCGADRPQNVGYDEESPPYIRPCTTRNVPPLSPLSAPSMVREPSGGQGPAKRLTPSRRLSPGTASYEYEPMTSNQNSESQPSQVEEVAGESAAELSTLLHQKKQETDAIEVEILRDQEEHDLTISRMTQERDELKHKLKENDEASSQLRKEIHQLESKSRTATNENSKKEKLLKQKESDRERRRAEVQRWAEQEEPTELYISQLWEEKHQLEEQSAKEIEELHSKTEIEQNRAKDIEKSNKVLSKRIKFIESEKQRGVGNVGTEEANHNSQRDQVSNQFWEARLQEMAHHYAMLRQQLVAADKQCRLTNAHLSRLRSCRPSENNTAYTQPLPLDLELGRRGTQTRRTRHRSSLNSNVSSPSYLPLQIDTSQSIPVTNDSPTSIGALINLSNGSMNVPLNEIPLLGKQEAFLNPVPMSPKAVDLLPKGLLGEDDLLEDAIIADKGPASQQSPSPTSNKRFSGHASNPWLDGPSHDATSPVSSFERPGSFLASPHGSIPNLADTELKSTESSESQHQHSDPLESSSAVPRKGFSGLFNFNRQRGKTTDEPPAIGSLKPAQSQSFPREVGESIEPPGISRRRRGSHAGPMSSLFPLGGSSTDRDPLANRLLSRRGVFPFWGATRQNQTTLGSLGGSEESNDQFSPRSDSLDAAIASGFRPENSPSRASSIYSFGEKLPRPSNDDNLQPFGWSNAERSGLRGSPLSHADWARPWSRNPSRRPSTQYGSATNLVLGPHLEESQPMQQEVHRPLQAPIGTRPSSSQAPRRSSPKLNPAVPSFKPKAFFGLNRDKEKDKEKAKPPTSEPSSRKDASREVNTHGGDDLSSSPPVSRKSRDSRSFTTADSIADSRESLERTVSSSTPSEPTAPALPAKETLMQKLTRKSSSTKFNSWKVSKDKSGSGGSGIFSREKKPAEPSTPDEVDEEDTLLGRSVDSSGSMLATPEGEGLGKPKEKGSRSSLSFGGFMKRRERDKAEKSRDKKGSVEIVDGYDDKGMETGTEDGE